MTNDSTCPECGRSNLYLSKEVSSGGGYAPNYLPGLGSFLSSAKFRVIVCKDCGLTRFFASKKALDKLPESSQWNKL
jgi:predicted nucleic-acid-binding Zn-ribbon protein